MTIDRRINKSKNALKSALIKLLNQKKFNNITITDLVNLADVNRGTFYNHYQSKEELLDELIDDVLHDLAAAYRKPYLHTDRFIVGELEASTVMIFEHIFSYADFYTSILISDILPGIPFKICEVLKQLLQHDQAFIVNSNKNIHAELSSSYYAFAIFGLIVEWVKGGFTYTPKHMAEQLIEILSYNNQRTIINTSAISKKLD